MNKQKGYIDIAELMIFLIIVLCIWLVVAGHERPEETQAIYAAWTKANPSVALTYDEWKLLRRKELLPGQVQTDSSGMATGVAVGVAAGMAGARR